MRRRRNLRNWPHDVYRAYDESGRLLYVGMTCDIAARMNRHRSSSVWYSQAVMVRVEVYPDRRSAQQAEARAIAEEGPVFNQRSALLDGTRPEPTEAFEVSLDGWVA